MKLFFVFYFSWGGGNYLYCCSRYIARRRPVFVWPSCHRACCCLVISHICIFYFLVVNAGPTQCSFFLLIYVPYKRGSLVSCLTEVVAAVGGRRDFVIDCPCV